MKTTQLYLFIFLSILLFWGCEQAIRFERGYDTKAVVWALIGPDTATEVVIYQTLPIEGWLEMDQENQFLRDLSPTLTINGDSYLLQEGKKRVSEDNRSYTYRGALDSMDLPFYYIEDRSKEGDRLSLSFEHEGVEYSAETTIPEKVAISKVEKAEIIHTDLFDTWTERVVRVHFQDLPGKGNFYRAKLSIRGWRYYREFDQNIGQFIIKDSIYDVGIRYGDIITDDFNDGGMLFADVRPITYGYEPIIVIDSNGWERRKFDYEMQIETISQEAATYLISTEQQWENGGDGLAEPVPLKGNIKNGLGMFGGYNISDTAMIRY